MEEDFLETLADPRLLRRYAVHLAEIAALARRRAADLEARARLRRKHPEEPFAAGLGRLAEELGDDAAAKQYGLARSTAALARKRYQRQQRETAREARKRRVLSLKNLGWTKKAIGARVGLHHNTVAKIIAEAERDW